MTDEELKDINKLDDSGKNRLHDAILKRDSDLVSDLIEKGADVNCKTSSGNSPLDLERTMKNIKVRELLVEAGAIEHVEPEEEKDVPEACLYYVTLKMYKHEDDCFRNAKGEKSVIISAQEVMGINSNDTWVGEYVNCGPLAFKSETFGGINPFQVGDYIVYKNHRSVKVGYDGLKYVTVSHHDLYNKVKNPSKFKAI